MRQETRSTTDGGVLTWSDGRRVQCAKEFSALRCTYSVVVLSVLVGMEGAGVLQERISNTNRPACTAARVCM